MDVLDKEHERINYEQMAVALEKSNDVIVDLMAVCQNELNSHLGKWLYEKAHTSIKMNTRLVQEKRELEKKD